ncbi:MAG: PIG-L deacetylase family protein [Prochloraceae cyanobacterium]|nr:PIG-L deacetylase family protein [Prochloraceae cyanobacterium]
MAVLIVVAHPDDEILGCGGTAAALASEGIEVRSCILSGQVDARQKRPDIPDLLDDIHTAQTLLCCKRPILGDFPNIKFNTIPHLKLVQFIEKAIEQIQADIIFTHHPHDLNNDHHHTSIACQAAARIFQRRSGLPPLRALYFMEILSATDWAFPSNGGEFRPDTFFEIGETLLKQKLEALRAYHGVMRDFPHPRSEEILKSLAAYRGGQAGMKYAEAFQTAFRALNTKNFGV